MGKYLERIEEFYQERIDEEESRLAYVGEKLFDFTTYDYDIAERFATNMIEVIDVIINRNNFEYIKDGQKHFNYINMVNMPFLRDRIDWGSSIRGAWLHFDNTSGEIIGFKIKNTDDFIEFCRDIIAFTRVIDTKEKFDKL